MDPNFGFTPTDFSIWAFSQLEQDYTLVSASLEKNDLNELRKLLDRKAFFLDEHLKSIWEKFPNLAVEYLDAYPKLAALCPLGFLEQQQNNPALITKLFDLGLTITADEYVSFSVRYPKIVSKVLQNLPDLAKECPVHVFERLEGFPQTERVRKVVEKAGAKIYKEDAEDTGMGEEVEEVKRSFKKIRVAEGSEEELPDGEGLDSE